MAPAPCGRPRQARRNAPAGGSFRLVVRARRGAARRGVAGGRIFGGQLRLADVDAALGAEAVQVFVEHPPVHVAHVVEEIAALLGGLGAGVGQVDVRVEARRRVQAGHADALEPLFLRLPVGQFQVLVDAGEERRVELLRLAGGRLLVVLFAHAVASGLESGGVEPACRRAITVWRSLSPRPDRLHSTRPSRGSSRASTSALATAWLDSSAGTMRSQRARRWNASSASSSPTPTYSARPASLRKACSGPTPG